MPEVGSTWVAVAPSAKGFGKTLNGQVKKQMGTSGLGKTLTNSAKVAMAGVGTAMAAGIGAVVKSGVELNAALGDYQARFTTLTGSADAARKAMAAMESVKLVSGQNKTDLLGFTQTLLGAGVGADQLEDRLRRLTKAGMDNNQNMQYLVRQYANVRNGAGLTEVQMIALQSRGFNPLRIAATELAREGESVEDSMARLRKEFPGTEGNAQLFTKAIELSTEAGGKFSNVLEDMQNTVAGSGRNLNNAWENFTQHFTGSIDGPLTGGLASFNNSIADSIKNVTFLAQNSGGLHRTWETVAAGLERAGQVIGTAIEQIAVKFFRFLNGVNFDAVLEGLTGMEGLLVPLGGVLAKVVGVIGAKVPIIGGAFKAVKGPVGIVIALFIKMWQESEILREAVGKLFGVFSETMESLQPVIEKISGLVIKLAGALGDALGTVIKTTVVPLIEALLPLLTKAIDIFVKIVGPVLECGQAVQFAVSAFMGLKVLKLVKGLVVAVKAKFMLLKAKVAAAGFAAKLFAGKAKAAAAGAKAMAAGAKVAGTGQKIAAVGAKVLAKGLTLLAKPLLIVSAAVLLMGAGVLAMGAAVLVAALGFQTMVPPVAQLAPLLPKVAASLAVVGVSAPLVGVGMLAASVSSVALGVALIGLNIPLRRTANDVERVAAASTTMASCFTNAVRCAVNSFNALGDKARIMAQGMKTAFQLLTQATQAKLAMIVAVWTAGLAAKQAAAVAFSMQLKAIFAQAMATIYATVSAGLTQVHRAMVTHWAQMKQSSIIGSTHVVAVTSALPGQIIESMGDTSNLLFGAGQEIVNGLIRGMESKLGNLSSMVAQVSNASARAGVRAFDGDLATIDPYAHPVGMAPFNAYQDIAGISAHSATVASTLQGISNHAAHAATSFRPPQLETGTSGYTAGSGERGLLKADLDYLVQKILEGAQLVSDGMISEKIRQSASGLTPLHP
jgi:hypothetical protein